MSATRPAQRPGSAEYAPESFGDLLRRIDRADLVRLGVVAVLALAGALVSWLATPWWLLVAIAAVGLVVGCWPILTEAWEDIRARRMSMELSMLIAIAAAAAIGEWVTALVITVFVLAAEILEDLSMDRGRDALTELVRFLPSTVQIRTGDRVDSVELDQVSTGDVVVVLPGGRVPVDGTVVEGRTSVDQSRITGEPLPVDVGVGSEVFAGSVNQDGAVEVRAQRVGADSSYGQIVAAVQAAQESRAPVQRLADRIAAWLVYIALGGAAVTYLLTRNPTATISVVLVAGACGVAAGTPLAVLAAIARAARAGAFVKDGTHLEALSGIDTMVFDKTGTLTVGAPAVSDVRAAPGHTSDEILTVAATAESYSEHPIGQAIVAHARALGLPAGTPQDFDYRPGLGIRATVDGRSVQAGSSALVEDAPSADAPTAGRTAVHVSIDNSYAGTILLADSLRESAAPCVQQLHGLGFRVVMMTGDSASNARSVADALGIDDVHAGLLPTQKVALVEELRRAGRRVAMVGDGVNDAPALAKAQVGIAMGTGTHVAHESADIVLISSDLRDLVQAVRTARRARRIIVTNVVGTIAVDLVGMVLAALGILGPLLAAIVHVASESAFILNSARLVPRAAADPENGRTPAGRRPAAQPQ
ncbi:heavy metal translocating P-type ATPase [Propionicicella superfundia]|uniref:heavy metal translocating P-type ATPase n=1 Tax=Propionicicella superfundia TaxID=348582 RepID=UPI0004072DD8|nr:cation-translocating P-type ATPase [Propionicicella superfundia]